MAPESLRSKCLPKGEAYGATTAVQSSEDVVSDSQLREASAKIRELEWALGRKTMEIEILRAAQEIVKKAVVAQRVRAVTHLPSDLWLPSGVGKLAIPPEMARTTGSHRSLLL